MKLKFLLIGVLCLGLGLRLYRLTDRPLGFTWDEAALGYNAYSLLHTGRDEYGQIAPLIFKSFGDYKPGAYIYTSVPSVAILGLNEFATRLPSAIFGTLLIVLVYVLVRRLRLSQSVALFSALSLAVCPLAIHFSRGAWEANLALFLTTLAAILFLRQKYIWSVLFFGLTFWTYQGAKLFTPLLMLSLVWLYKPRINFKASLRLGALFAVFLLPIVMGLSSQTGRLKVFSVFSYTRKPESIREILAEDSSTSFGLTYYLFHTETLDQLRGVAARYLNHFSPRFLFIDGNWSDARQATAPFYGNFHLPELLSILLGGVILIKTSLRKSGLLFMWLLLAPLPSALSRDIISSVRSLPMMIPLCIISGAGLAWIFKHSRLFIGYSIIGCFFLLYFLDLYFIHSPQYTAVDWLSPYKPVMQLLSQNTSKYSHLVVTDKLGQPYIFALFYLRLDPHLLPQSVTRIDNPQGDVGQVTRLGNFSFRTIYWPADRSQTSTIFVGDQYELPESDLTQTPSVIRLGTVNYPNGAPGLKVVALP